MSANHSASAKSNGIDQPLPVAGTARFIARSLLVARQDKQDAALLPPGSREWCQRLLVAAGDRAFVRAANYWVFRAIFRAAIDLVLPGIVLHYLARKRCLEDWLRQVCARDRLTAGGCRQIVVLGAGLDTLACRLHRERPDLSFFELDRPAALGIKEKAIAAEGQRQQNLTFVPIELGRESLTQALQGCPSFDASISTLFLAEGLLMYLPLEQVQSLFREIAAFRSVGGPHVFAFTFMEARPDGRIGFRRSNRVVDWWLRRQREPFRWSHAPEALPAFLGQAGFVLRELASGDTLRARYLEPVGLQDAPLAMGEWLALAQMETVT